MRVVVRAVGNSAGVIIPRPFMSEIGLSAGDDVDIKIEGGALVVRPIRRHPRAGWAADAKTLADEGSDDLVWPEFGNAEDAELKW